MEQFHVAIQGKLPDSIRTIQIAGTISCQSIDVTHAPQFTRREKRVVIFEVNDRVIMPAAKLLKAGHALAIEMMLQHKLRIVINHELEWWRNLLVDFRHDDARSKF